MTNPPFQLFPALDPAVEAALRASVQRWGVLVPVAKDQHGRILDGHHRSRIADELGVRYAVLVHHVADDEDAEAIARTLNTDRRHLTVEQRREMVAVLREQGHSQRAIAGAVGVSRTQVRNDLAQVGTSAHLNEPETVAGKDGKRYPAKRPERPKPTPTVFARDERQAERAQQALADLGTDAPTAAIDSKRAERLAREKASEQRRAEAETGIADSSTHDSAEIRYGDFRDVLRDLSGQADAVITDPPYKREFLPLYEDLGMWSREWLKPTGMLVVMTGTRLELLDEVDRLIGRWMRRRWRGVYLVPGQRWRDQAERVATGYKPVLIYVRPDAEDLRWINDDVFRSDGARQDERFHKWGQTESGMASIVERLTLPGELVVDPFVGGGTTAVVCRDLGRPFIGCDSDALAVARSRERLA